MAVSHGVGSRYTLPVKKLPRLAILWLLLGWVLVVLYPDPSVLVRSVENIRHPKVDPVAVKSLAATLPDNPLLIEDDVLTRLVPYAYDWQTNGVPWYFPTTAEVLQQKRGDCESRAVLLASILKAKGIPFQLVMSLDHIWVQYPGKPVNGLENDGVMLAHWVNGHLVWQWPSGLRLGAEINAQLDDYWTPMPLVRRLLLFGGVLLLLLLNSVAAARLREQGFAERGRLLAAPVSPPWAVLRLRLRTRKPGPPPVAVPPQP